MFTKVSKAIKDFSEQKEPQAMGEKDLPTWELIME